ncbi:PepSY domain-containing protein [Chelativorans salis]|uniref:PepSY domain-containing protein n=1 Tax=Chelativorans salis TaxID=2978478 RepID=A0ABT2LUM3_9HYPH|nr:PepSY domain-containing protein [Chelativorans sp. EGI FJ00035]MCT7378091.1 PepSY domain-containing protein [Chelativorans sp. EGI FJ00035]
MKNAVLAGALAAMVAGSALPAYAETGASDKTEMQAALAAKVSMSEAVQAAEDKSGGKVMEAVFSDENGKPGYEVSTVQPDGTEQNFFVDASTGEAVKATAAAENENDGSGTVDDSQEGEYDE